MPDDPAAGANDGARLDDPRVQEELALKMFLGPIDPTTAGPHSPLDAALRDTRSTMDHGVVLWLATLGYLVTAQIIGRTIARPDTQLPERESEKRQFEAGVTKITENPLTETRVPKVPARVRLTGEAAMERHSNAGPTHGPRQRGRQNPAVHSQGLL